MADNAIRLVEGSKVTWTFNFRRGGAAFDLTNYTVSIFVHEDGIDKDTNLIDGESATVDADPTTGIVTYQFVASKTNFVGDTLQGTVWFRLAHATVDDFYVYAGKAFITRNPCIA